MFFPKTRNRERETWVFRRQEKRSNGHVLSTHQETHTDASPPPVLRTGTSPRSTQSRPWVIGRSYPGVPSKPTHYDGRSRKEEGTLDCIDVSCLGPWLRFQYVPWHTTVSCVSLKVRGGPWRSLSHEIRLCLMTISFFFSPLLVQYDRWEE